VKRVKPNLTLHVVRRVNNLYSYTKLITKVEIQTYFMFLWTAVAQWLMCCATNRKVPGSIPAGVSGFSIDIKYFRSHYGPGVDSASNRNKYEEHFQGVLISQLSTVPLEKLNGFQLVKKFLAFCGTRRFITAFTSAQHPSLS